MNAEEEHKTKSDQASVFVYIYILMHIYKIDCTYSIYLKAGRCSAGFSIEISLVTVKRRRTGFLSRITFVDKSKIIDSLESKINEVSSAFET